MGAKRVFIAVAVALALLFNAVMVDYEQAIEQAIQGEFFWLIVAVHVLLVGDAVRLSLKWLGDRRG